MHEKRIDIRWRDLDALGHVNQAVYQTYSEEVLDDFFRTRLGLRDGQVWDYVAARFAVDYRTELRLADKQVVGSARVEKIGTSSLTARIDLRAADGRLAAEVEVVAVTWDLDKREKRPITDAERAALAPAH